MEGNISNVRSNGRKCNNILRDPTPKVRTLASNENFSVQRHFVKSCVVCDILNWFVLNFDLIFVIHQTMIFLEIQPNICIGRKHILFKKV
jgi:hypothetical protein